MHRCELTTQEVKLLVGYYDNAIDELEKCKSPILHAILADNVERRDEIERMLDARYWNRGKGRKKAPADPGPDLPIESNYPQPHGPMCICA